MERVALAVAYDGGAFDSFARQPRRRTVEGELLAALGSARAFEDPRQARWALGSRTDARVSAAFNVVAFDSALPAATLAGRLQTPPGLWALSSRSVPAAFNPRHARMRRYRYVAPKSMVPDVASFRTALALFRGTHDFTGFSRREAGRDPVRRVARTAASARGLLVEATVTAPSFLWQQVRRMVAAAAGVSQGRWTLTDVRRVLTAAEGLGPFGAAPAEGLLLEHVDYGLAFPLPPRRTRRAMQELLLGSRIRLRLAEAVKSKDFPPDLDI